MDARCCDRCGAYYIPEFQAGILVVSKSIMESRNGRPEILYYENVPVVKQDLCKDCVESFKYWFNVPTLYNNDARGEKHD